MMAALLARHLGDEYVVESAGLDEHLAGRPANHRSVTCMDERGIDLRGHRSRWVGDVGLGSFGWIVCVGGDEADQVRATLGRQRIDGPTVLVANEDGGGVPDPYDHGLAGYRACVTLLDQALPAVAAQIQAAGAGRETGA